MLFIEEKSYMIGDSSDFLLHDKRPPCKIIVGGSIFMFYERFDSGVIITILS